MGILVRAPMARAPMAILAHALAVGASRRRTTGIKDRENGIETKGNENVIETRAKDRETGIETKGSENGIETRDKDSVAGIEIRGSDRGTGISDKDKGKGTETKDSVREIETNDNAGDRIPTEQDVLLFGLARPLAVDSVRFCKAIVISLFTRKTGEKFGQQIREEVERDVLALKQKKATKIISRRTIVSPSSDTFSPQF